MVQASDSFLSEVPPGKSNLPDSRCSTISTLFPVFIKQAAPTGDSAILLPMCTLSDKSASETRHIGELGEDFEHAKSVKTANIADKRNKMTIDLGKIL
ncbi:hypothetical protein ALT721_950003 [Alteromonas alvinellae]